MVSRKPKPKAKPDTALSVLLRIEKLLQATRSIDDRVAECNERLRKRGWRWEFRAAARGNVNHYLLHRDSSDGTETQVMVIPDIEPEGHAEWHLTEGAPWRPEPSLGHAFIAAAEAFLETL